MRSAIFAIVLLLASTTSALATVNVSSPADNSTVASPVSYVASASTSCAKGVSAMGVYVDNVRVVVQNGASLNASVPMSSGHHYTVVQEWDACGGSTTAAINLTVGTSTGATTVAISASPSSVSAGGSSVLTVTASNATQVTIHGSDGSSYTLPTSGGTQTVSPKATTTYTATATGANGSVTSSTNVTVTAQNTPGVFVSSPVNNSTVASPVSYVASASTSCAKGVSAMGVYVDNVRVVVQNGASLNASVPMSSGHHYTVVQEWDACGGSTTAAINLTVGTAANTTTVAISASPTSVSAGGSSVLTVTTSNATQVTISGSDGSSYTLPTSGGTQTVSPKATTTYTATATGANGSVTSSTNVTVNAQNTPGVFVSSPVNNSTVASPVSYVASASTSCAKGVSAMGVYVDNVRVVVQNGASLNASVPMSSGHHYTVVQEWDACGGSTTAAINLTVGTATGATTVAISASPSSITSGSSSVLSVTASNATQVTISGSDGSSYTLPTSGGTQTVSPKATTTYTATATGANGSVTSSTTVVVPGTGNAVLMHHNDLAGDGANLNETTLTLSNVNEASFGRKFALPVDGQIYAQPLYVPGLEVNGSAHDTVFAATQNDSVYAFDADSGAQLWRVSLGTAVPNNDPEGVQPILGILSTPVIDPSTNTMYVTAVTTGSVLQLHALDITSGAEKFGGPVNVNASVPGSGDGSSNGMVPLSRGCYQRTALTLANGQIYLGFGHCNHGWLLAYSASTLAQTHVLNTSPDGVGATIWMGGAAPVVDSAGNIYVITADDIGTTAPSSNDFPDTFLKLSPSLQVLDSFTPSNERYLAENDADLGSGGPILLPDNTSSFPHELIGGGKDGRVFVVNRDNMGGYHPDPNGQNDNIQTVQTGTQQFDNIWGSPALFWDGFIYYHTENDVLRAYSWSNGLMSVQPAASGTTTYLNHGASPSISANGTNNGILWDIDDSGYPSGGGSGGTPAILHAHNASNVGQELYNSSQAPNGRDTAGHACKFSVPTVTDGKVFVPTCTELDIYGLLP